MCGTYFDTCKYLLVSTKSEGIENSGMLHELGGTCLSSDIYQNVELNNLLVCLIEKKKRNIYVVCCCCRSKHFLYTVILCHISSFNSRQGRFKYIYVYTRGFYRKENLEEIESNFFELKGHVGHSCEQPMGAISSVVRKSWPMCAAKCHRVGDKATDNDMVVDLQIASVTKKSHVINIVSCYTHFRKDDNGQLIITRRNLISKTICQ